MGKRLTFDLNLLRTAALDDFIEALDDSHGLEIPQETLEQLIKDKYKEK